MPEVGALSVVKIQICPDTLLGFSPVLVSLQVHLLVFDAPPQPLHEDVVQVAPVSVHAEGPVFIGAHLDSQCQQCPGGSRTGELTTSIGVEHLRFPLTQGFL